MRVSRKWRLVDDITCVTICTTFEGFENWTRCRVQYCTSTVLLRRLNMARLVRVQCSVEPLAGSLDNSGKRRSVEPEMASGETEQSSRACIDVLFPTTKSSRAVACTPDFLRFRNYYGFTLSVLAKHSPLQTSQRGYQNGHKNSHGSWVVLLREYQMMEDPHHENDAQQWHLVHLPRPPSGETLKSLRLVLSNPSCLWSAIDLHNIECFQVEPGAQSFQEAVSSLVGGAEKQCLDELAVRQPENIQGRYLPDAAGNLISTATNIQETLRSLQNCKSSVVSNPSAALDFSSGAASSVKITR